MAGDCFRRDILLADGRAVSPQLSFRVVSRMQPTRSSSASPTKRPYATASNEFAGKMDLPGPMPRDSASSFDAASINQAVASMGGKRSAPISPRQELFAVRRNRRKG